MKIQKKIFLILKIWSKTREKILSKQQTLSQGMETLTKLLPATVDLYWVKPGQTGQTLWKEMSSKGQIPWCSQTRQAATRQEESIIWRKAAEAQLSLKNFWGSMGPTVPLLSAEGQEGIHPIPTALSSCLV